MPGFGPGPYPGLGLPTAPPNRLLPHRLGLPLRSGSRSFSQAEEIMAAASYAIAQATALIRASLTPFLMYSPLIPRDTGRMAYSALMHLVVSALAGDLNLLIWFDTFYAEYVEFRQQFVQRLMPHIREVVQTSILTAFKNNGLELEVVI